MRLVGHFDRKADVDLSTSNVDWALVSLIAYNLDEILRFTATHLKCCEDDITSDSITLSSKL